MSRTFEELAGNELDALYRGALFLSGGDGRDAEQLLVDTVTLAFHQHTSSLDGADFHRSLEERLVRAFLRSADQPPTPRPVVSGPIEADAASFDELGADELFDAAGRLPRRPRAALWLVLMRRWSYEDASEAMNLEVEALQDLLAYRDTFMQALLRSRRTRNRARKES